MSQRANPIRRILATLIDFTIFWIAAWCIALLIEPPLRSRIQTRAEYVLSLIMIGLWLLYTSLEMIAAATPGKLFLGLRIVRSDGSEAPAAVLVMRWSSKQLPSILTLFGLLTFNAFLGWTANLTTMILWVGCLQMLDEDRRSWLDMWAHTAVIKEGVARK
jgi:uncharacterized RDD family membrane protein YckC